MFRNQKGFTLVELITCLWALFCLSLVGLVGYVIWHFISKFW